MDTSAVPLPGQAQDPLVGRLLDRRYRLETALARGGMATVYTATDTRLDRVVAVKVMHRALADDPAFVERFTREARAAARLAGPEVVAVHDQGTDDATGLAYLVMEYVEGRTLRDLIVARGPLPPGPAVDLLLPVLRALAAAHAAGLVHRDVKPENVLLGDDGRIKVADFGLVGAVETSAATVGLLMGTVTYLAPEQVERGVADPRSDVYAAGIVLWELLTGAPPYGGETPMSVAYRHVHEDVPPPGTVVRGLPAALDELVVRATRRDPAARPVDAGAFLAELAAVRADVGGHRAAPTLVVRRPAPPDTRPTGPGLAGPGLAGPGPRGRRPGRGTWIALVVALLTAAAVAVGLYLGSARATVPSVLELTRADATSRLQTAGFTVQNAPDRFDETVATGQVAEQRPAGRTRARRGAVVTLVVSKGQDRRAVPPVVGQQQAAAAAALQAAGLRVGTVTRAYGALPPGAVLRSSPAPGVRLRPDTPVDLAVSRGLEMLPVPSVVGKPADAASAQLQAAGLHPVLAQVFSDSVPAGSVVAQDPADGRAPRGSDVAVQVSKGPDTVVVPELRGLKLAEATDALTRLGLKARVVELPYGGGAVVTQNPRPDTRVRRGSTVALYVL